MKIKHCHSSHPRFGVFNSWFRGDYQFELVSGIEHEAKRNDVQVFYFIGRFPHSPWPYEAICNCMFDIALDASLDGLVITPMISNYSTKQQMNEFASRFSHIPLVTINFKTEHGNAILTNNAPGFQRLMQHLIEYHGYRKFAFLNGPAHNFDAVERADIYKSMLNSYGISFDPSFIVNGHYIYISGMEMVAEFFDDRKLKPGRDIEVIVCANDMMALGVLDELETRGIRVPSDIAVTGFDGMRYTFFPKAPVTTVRQHAFEIGKTSILNLINYDPDREDIIFDTELVIHSSCGCSVENTPDSYGVNPEPHVTQKSKNKPIDRTLPENLSGKTGYWKDFEYFFSQTIISIYNMRLLNNMSEWDEWLLHNLPGLKIGSAYLFMYTDSFPASRSLKLIASYNRKKVKQEKKGQVIPFNYVFDEILTGSKRISYCILPLHYQNDIYGLAAMEVSMQSAYTYDALSNQIGNTIRGLMLMEKLRKANEQKTQFFINVAHETKTPLTLIRNYLERSIERHPSDNDLAIVKQNIDIMLQNILNLLDAERLSKGMMSFSHDSFIDLSEASRQKCALFRPVAEKKNITISLNAEKDIIIKIDPDALDRILNNLLDNAVKYTQKGGKVSIKVRKTNGKAILRVSDNGPGLSVDTILHLFDPYYQLSQKRTSKQGIGVGLSIVKKIIDDLSAVITASNNKNGGASFICEFIACTGQVAKKQLKNIPLLKPPAGIVFDENIKEEDISSDKSSILIVDDNVQMLNFLKVSLKNKYNVFLATDVPAAIAKLNTIVRPELIISDIMMDGMDGHALLEKVAETEEFCDIPFIFLTAVSNQDEEIRSLAEGAIDYIKKPFSLPELEKKIESIITLRKRMKKRDVMDIRKGIEGLLSKIENSKKQHPGTVFESLCIKYNISAREKEIIKLMLEGLINKEIAGRLNLSTRTVEYHITNIYKKAGISKRYDLISLFRI
ncbi:MAG: response regulator [Acidobacteria bacterium]|nr:response regulator [Acidobacteriota bacterium]